MKRILLFSLLGLFSFQSDEASAPLALPEHFPEPTYDLQAMPWDGRISELGRKLFYDPLLSRDGRISCASCHSPFNAFAHTDHALSHGIDDSVGQRNAPALFNLAWKSHFMWDGAISLLDQQALIPLSHPSEMGDTLPHILGRLRRNENYRKRFSKAFGDTVISTQKLLHALAQFQLSLISDKAKYDEVKRGNRQFNEQEQNGYALFLQHCNSCHTEPLFTSDRIVSNGLPPDPHLQDLGRFRISQNPKDSFRFQIPSLRNLSYTYPYMHDGRFDRLKEVMEHYTREMVVLPNIGEELTAGITLSSADQKDLMAFLFTLNDSSFCFDPRFGFSR